MPIDNTAVRFRTRLLGACLSAGVASMALASAVPARAAGPEPLTQVAHFADDQITGVAVAPNGRIFVNLPRWDRDVAVSVAEVVDGKLKPYPSADWNAWRNAKHLSPADHWICVQSVTVDPQGFLWVLDPAAPAMSALIDGGPKLVKIDLAKNTVVQTIAFDKSLAPEGSYLNDVRFSPDGKTAYLTDSGFTGALLVVDTASGGGRRLLAGDKSTQPEQGVIVHADGKELRRTDGRPTVFAADGVALSADGQTLYWQALTGKTLYSLPTSAINDAGLSPADLAAKVVKVGTTNVADGLWADKKNNLYITAPEEDALKRRTPDGKLETVVRDKRLRWPDSMAEGADGSIYLTTSHIQDMPWYHAGSTRKTPSEIWKVAAPK